MALVDIYNEVREILTGQGFGEKPSVRLAAADSSESLSAPFITFSLVSGEGANVGPSDILAAYSPDDPDGAFVIYVTSMDTDDVTGINGALMGAPLAATDDLDGVLLEQNPLVTGHGIHNAIKAVVARHLWPEVYNVEHKTISAPDLIDGQEAVDSDVEEIMAAWQIIGPTAYSIDFQRHPRDVNTSIKSTGRMAAFSWIDGSTGYYTAKTKLISSDDDATPELSRLIATGAAAIALGGTIVETTLENTKKDNADAVSQRTSAGSILWRDFLTLKQEYARELGRHNEARILIDRG